MDSRGGGAEGQAMNAWIRETPMREMAHQLGIDELPMRREDFDFYRHAVYHLQQMGMGGQDLFHAAHEVIQLLFFKLSKGTPGVIYKYVKWYEKRVKQGLSPPQFDEFFKYAFKQKALTARKNWLRQKKKRGLSLDYGRGEDDGGVDEAFLKDTGEPSVEEAYAEQEESERREKVFRKIPQMLTDERLGKLGIYIPIWEMMQKNYKIREIAEELNAKGILSPSGNQWGNGSVSKVREQIYDLVKRFLKRNGIDWESIIASRKRGFRFGFILEG